MNSVLVDFFNGRLIPIEASESRSPQYKELEDRITELEQKLHDAQSNEEAKRWLDELHECSIDQMGYRTEDCFKTGFSLGLRMAVEAYAKEEVLQKLLDKLECSG